MCALSPSPRTQLQVKVGRRFLAIAGMALLSASVALNVVLAHQLRSFHQSRSIKASERLLKINTIVPPIAAKRLDGQQALISYHSTRQPTVLYIFTPPCQWCARNMD